MKIENICYVNDLISKRKEIIDRLNPPYGVKDLINEINYLKITIEISSKDDYGCRYPRVYREAKDIKITKYEGDHLISMLKTYNEEELIRIEQELKDLGVEIESKDSCDNETVG